MTAAGRKTASKLTEHDHILVVARGENLWPTTKKHTGRNEVLVARVESVESVLYSGGRKAQRRYQIHTTLGTVEAAPAETFGVLAQDQFDTASSNSRQHYIDTGRYLTHVEQKLIAKGAL